MGIPMKMTRPAEAIASTNIVMQRAERMLAIIVARCMTAPRQGGLEHLGGFVLTLAAWAGMLAASAVGMIAAGVGLHRSKGRGVRRRTLRITFAANLVEFFLVFLLPALRM